MWNWIKEKTKSTYRWIKEKINKVLISLGIVSVALAMGTEMIVETPYLTIDGQKIETSYTDNNSGENLIIRTDQERYFNFAGNFPVYFSVENKSGSNQHIKMVFSFYDATGEKKYVDAILEYAGENKTLIPASIVPARISTTTGEEIPERIIPAKEIVETIWTSVPMSKAALSGWVNRKSIKNAKEDKGNDFLLQKGETRFFKAVISYTGFTGQEEFFIEAFGDKGAYGHLDPWTYELLFDDLNDGGLDGQDSWALVDGSDNFDVGATAALYGTKGLHCHNSDGSDYDRTMTAITAGTWYWSFKIIAMDADDWFTFNTATDNTNNNSIYMIIEYDGGTDYELSYYNGGTGQNFLATLATNTKYIVEVEFDGSRNSGKGEFKWNLWTDGSGWGTQSGWLKTRGTCDSIDYLNIWSASGGNDVYFDNLSPTDPEAAPAVPVVPMIMEF